MYMDIHVSLDGVSGSFNYKLRVCFLKFSMEEMLSMTVSVSTVHIKPVQQYMLIIQVYE